MKINDWVTCIDDKGIKLFVTLGRSYRVVNVDTHFVEIITDIRKPGTFDIKRFELNTSNVTIPLGFLIDLEEDSVPPEDVFGFSPIKPLVCTCGGKFVGNTHDVTCDVYDPNRKVEF